LAGQLHCDWYAGSFTEVSGTGGPVFFRYPLATSLNRRKFSMCPSKFEMRYMGYNITMSAPSRRQPSAAAASCQPDTAV